MKSDHKSSPDDVKTPKEHCIQDLPLPQPVKKKNRNKSDLGENFIAPDGGWGWLVAIAAGISMLVSFALLQQFGILFRQRFQDIGIHSSQITTILNTQMMAATCTGLFNGAIFRRFSIRQISLFGSILIFIGLILTVFADSFLFYILTISIMYGIGKGIVFTSFNMAVNTYFKEKRRSATACLFTVAGLGPIILPYVCTYLVSEYGVAWAVLFYAGLSLHNFAAALIYQPVKWHVKKQKDFELDNLQQLNIVLNSRNIEKLNSVESSAHQDVLNHNRDPNYSDAYANHPLKAPKNSFAAFEPILKPIPKIILRDETNYLENAQDVQKTPPKSSSKSSVFKRISTFLDLDLLQDFTYVNLAIGLTLIQFVELNFAFLTPFILNEFGYDSSQIAQAMSLKALCDILMRISISFMSKKISYSNKNFLLFSLLGICLGRIVLVYNRSYTMVLVCFAWMGFCYAIRMVCWILVLPSYVPLNRLPAAIGLQRAIMGLFSLALGPLIGLIRDASNYGFTLLCMNDICFLVVFAWWGEDLFKWIKSRKANQREVDEVPESLPDK